MRRKVTVILLSALIAAATLVGCGKSDDTASTKTEDNISSEGTTEGSTEIKEFSAFFAVEGAEINNDNEIQQMITDIIGAKCKETWLTGQTAEEAIGMMIAGGEYPDFIVGSSGTSQLIDAGALIPVDEYWDEYPNLKNFWSEEEWNKARNEDGHIYIMPEFGNVYLKDTDTIHWDEAFWIQTRVLKWAGYPEIKTLDQLFELLETYSAANPTMEDGTPVIPYEILTDDWYYFCLENPPMFLAGYPNDGCALVNPDTGEVMDYNTTEIAYRYFEKLNEEYKKGIIDQECFTMSRDQYIEKISSGRVLCMVDQYWNFLTGEDAIKTQGLDDCTYVPLGITMDEGITDRYRSASAIDVSNGVGISVSCKDIEGALKFLNNLLEPEIQTLRFWGVEGVDYLVDEEGIFYRTQEMRDSSVDATYKASHLCTYSYFPFHEGMNHDEINAYNPGYQPSEFFDGLKPEVQECLAAYGAETYCDMLTPGQELTPWYPLWSFSNSFTTDTEGGLAWVKVGEVKHEYLPKAVIAGDFTSAWDEYLDAYNNCDPQAFLSEMQDEVNRRVKVAAE